MVNKSNVAVSRTPKVTFNNKRMHQDDFVYISRKITVNSRLKTFSYANAGNEKIIDFTVYESQKLKGIDNRVGVAISLRNK